MKRVIVSVLWIAFIGVFMYFELAYAIVIALLCLWGVMEFYMMVENKGIYPFKYIGASISFLIPISFYFGFEINRNWQLLLVIIAVLTIFVLQIRRRVNEGATAGISTTIFGVLYVAWALTFLLRIRLLPEGLAASLLTIFATKGADIGAYLWGSRFGRIPFLKRISPNKTLEGFWAGIVFSILAAFVFGGFVSYLNVRDKIILGIMGGVLGQLGDISESLMKRDCDVKDSGDIFPGIGGVLDLIDSLIFTCPPFYFYLTRIAGQ